MNSTNDHLGQPDDPWRREDSQPRPPLPPPLPPRAEPPAYSTYITPVTPASYAPSSPYPQYVIQQPPTSGMAVTSMALSIIGLVGSCCTFGVPSLVGVILGHMALGETKRGKGGHGMAIAGLVMGYIGIAPAIIFSIWMIFMGGMAAIGVATEPSASPSPTF